MVGASMGCSVCGAPRFRKDLCSVHYHRMREHGNFDQRRPADWGQRSKHPLWERWKSAIRRERVPAWDDFWVFVADVGEPPEPSARLYKLDGKKPLGPGNWVWRALVTADRSTREGRNARMRQWHRNNPGKSREYEMRKRRGMSLSDYDALAASQGDVCAICKKTDPNFRLAIDHDHETGENRGLLCSKCNRALGMLDDSEDRAVAAATYLTRWRRTHRRNRLKVVE